MDAMNNGTPSERTELKRVLKLPTLVCQGLAYLSLIHIWIKVIEENVKPKFVELNKKAFEMGRNA